MYLRLLALVLMILSIVGCTAEPAPEIRFDRTVEYPPPSHLAKTLRLGVVTMLSAQDSFAAYRDLADYLTLRTNVLTDLIFRKSYAELNDLVRTGAVDLALVGYGGYLTGQKQFGMVPLALGQVDGITRSDALIVVRAESPARGLADLRDKTFAFTDPLSYSGHLAVRDWMQERGLVPEDFFERVLFTYSQSASVEALVGRVVEGAVVNAYRYRAYLARHPGVDGQLRVIARLPTPGGLVFAVAPNLQSDRRQFLREVLLGMHENPGGRAVLAGLMLERLVPPREGGMPHAR